MIRRKNWLLILILLLFFLSSGSCQKSADNIPEKVSNGKKVLQFWTISLKPIFNDYMENLILRYEKENPEVTIKWVDIPFDAIGQKLAAAVAGGVTPDIVNLNTLQVMYFAQQDALADISGLALKSQYFPQFWEAGRYKKSYYGFPWYVSTKVIMYNSEIFQKAGLSTPPKTWDEVVSYAVTIKKKTGIYGYMPAINLCDEFQLQGIPLVNSDETKAVFLTKGAVAIVELYANLFKDGYIPRETVTDGYKGAVERYQRGCLGMLITGPQFLKRVKKASPDVYRKTKVAPLPLGKAGIVPAALMHLVVMKASSYPKEAAKFALYATNSENQLGFCKIVSIMPSTPETIKDSYFEKMKTGTKTPEEFSQLISLQQLPIAKDLTLNLPNSTKLVKTMKIALEGAMLNEGKPEETLLKAQKDWDNILNLKEVRN